jgi:hypothetical protein
MTQDAPAAYDDAKAGAADAPIPAHDANGGDASAAPHPDSAVATVKDAAATKDAYAMMFPDAGAAVMACESCLSSTCGTDVIECLDDPSCESAITCTITSGCIALDAGGIEGCVNSCIKSEGLTPHETAQLVQELTTLSTCATPCLSKCGASDAGNH